MALPGVENVGAPRESIFNLSRGPQLPYIKNPIFEPQQKNVFSFFKKKKQKNTKSSFSVGVSVLKPSGVKNILQEVTQK